MENRYVCPKCKSDLKLLAEHLSCGNCNSNYKVKERIPVFITKPVENNLVGDYLIHYSKDGEVFDYYQERDAQLEHDDWRMHQFVFRHVPERVEKILDVGAGANWVAEYAIPKGFEVHAVDISLRNIKVALEKYKDKKYYGVVADAYALPYPDNTFDVIIASEVIEHVIEPEKFVKNLFSLLKPEGRLIITCPYKEKIQQHLCIHCNKLTPSNAHLHSFDKAKMRALYKGNDLQKMTSKKYSNKLLSFLRCYAFLKIFPYAIWKWVDWIMNSIIPKPARMLTVYYKGVV